MLLVDNCCCNLCPAITGTPPIDPTTAQLALTIAGFDASSLGSEPSGDGCADNGVAPGCLNGDCASLNGSFVLDYLSTGVGTYRYQYTDADYTVWCDVFQSDLSSFDRIFVRKDNEPYSCLGFNAIFQNIDCLGDPYLPCDSSNPCGARQFNPVTVLEWL